MRKFSKVLSITLSLMLLLQPFAPLRAEPVDVIMVTTATIADVNLVINGTPVFNERSMFPVLSYQYITYFPITFNYMLALGMVSTWSEETGLSVDPADAGPAPLLLDILPDNTPSQQPGSQVVATTPDFPIILNGTPAVQDEWPFLRYNYITYMPMTWHNMVTIFGFNYIYDEESNTLYINSSAEQLVVPPIGEATIVDDPFPPLPGRRVTVEDIQRWPNAFRITDMQADETVMAFQGDMQMSMPGILEDGLNILMDMTMDLTTSEILFSMIIASSPELALLGIEELAMLMYMRPNPANPEFMQIFVSLDGVWEELLDAEAAIFPSAMFSIDLEAQIPVFEAMGMTEIVAMLQDPTNPEMLINLYSLYYLDVIEEDGTTYLLFSVAGTMEELLAVYGLHGAGMGNMMLGMSGMPVDDDDALALMDELFGDAIMYMSFLSEAETGRSLEMSMFMRMTIEGLTVEYSMFGVFDYDVELVRPAVD